MRYELVAGLETHVELSTKTKIFCGCTTEFGGSPNTLLSDMYRSAGHPAKAEQRGCSLCYKGRTGYKLRNFKNFKNGQKELLLSGSVKGLPDFTV